MTSDAPSAALGRALRRHEHHVVVGVRGPLSLPGPLRFELLDGEELLLRRVKVKIYYKHLKFNGILP